MSNYGKAIEEVRNVMKENGIKEFAVQMDDEASTYSYDKSTASDKIKAVVNAIKED